MKSIFRATAILSGSSVVSILVGLVSAKVMALVLQPAGYGYYGVLQSFVAVASLLVALGIPTGLVRTGAVAVREGDQGAISSLRGASWLLFSGLGAVTLLVLALFHDPIGRWALGTPNHTSTIMLMGVAVLLTVSGQIQSGTLNAYHRVKALAKCGIGSSVLGAGTAITCVLIWGVRGVVPAVVGVAAIASLVSWYFLRRDIGPVPVHSTHPAIRNMARKLLCFGGPYTMSLLIGTGVQLAMPMIVMHLLTTEAVGYYKAAAAISVGYLGFLVTAMGQDYYPRVSAVKDQPGALVKLINEQHRLVMIVALPMILGTLALVPYLVPLVYSAKFTPTVEILEWQLIGDVFRFSSWTMSFAILARCSSATYFFTEACGGLVSLVTLWLGVRWFGLAGLGISFLVSYVVYYGVVWVVVRREVPLVWTGGNKWMMLFAVGATLVIRVLPLTMFAELRTAIALSLAAGTGLRSMYAIWWELRGRAAKEMKAA